MFLEHITPGVDLGWIEVVTGSMFSGKTEELLRRLRRACFAHQKVMLFKPRIDTRYSATNVVSHDSNELSAMAIDEAYKIMDLSADAQVIGIDEAQFFDVSLIDVCRNLASSGKRVVVAGLDMDFRGEPFGPMPQLLAIAEFVDKVHAICVKCGRPAQYSHRLTKSSDLVLLGETDRYEPLCRHCFDGLTDNRNR